MARRHVIEYYIQQQNLYLEMLENLDCFKTLATEGKIDEEDYNNAVKDIELTKQYYEWLSYIVLLMNKPNRKTAKEDDFTKALYSSVSGVSKEALLDETKDALADFKKIVKKSKETK